MSHFGVSYTPHPIPRGIIPPKLSSSINPPLAARGTYEWYMSKASLRDCCGIQFCIDEQTKRLRYIGMLIHYSQGYREALGQFRWDLRVTEMILPSQAQYQNHVIEGKHHIQRSLSAIPVPWNVDTNTYQTGLPGCNVHTNRSLGTVTTVGSLTKSLVLD